MTANGHRWFAAAYDRITAAAERGPVGRARRELLAGLSGDIVEIGAGTGANFEHYPPGVRVVAFEPDPHMLKRARARLDTLARADIDLRSAPAESLLVPDAFFDVAVSTLVLCTVDDPAASLAEIKRVLRPGGTLVFIEHVRGRGVLGRIQDLIRPVWSWGGAGCQLNRNTEATMRAVGFSPDVTSHFKPMPLLPMIVGTATFA